MDFEGLAAGRIIPPWTPTVVGSMDTSQFDMEFTSMLPVGKEKLFFTHLTSTLLLYSLLNCLHIELCIYVLIN